MLSVRLTTSLAQAPLYSPLDRQWYRLEALWWPQGGWRFLISEVPLHLPPPTTALRVKTSTLILGRRCSTRRGNVKWYTKEGSYLRLIDFVSLNSRLESNKEEERKLGGRLTTQNWSKRLKTCV